MASGLNLINNRYTGFADMNVVAPLVAGSTTFKNKLCKVHNVAGIKNLLKGDVDVIIQDATAQFNADGQITQNYTDTIIAPIPFSVMIEVAKIDLYNTYSADYLQNKGLLNFSEFTPDLRGFVYDQAESKVNANVEELVWNGRLLDPANFTASSTPTGWIPRLKSASPTSQRLSIPTSGTYAGTAISADGKITLTSTANLNNGDIVTISAVTGVTVDGENIVGKSYQISVLSSTQIQLFPYDGGDAIAVTGAGTKAITFGTINRASSFDALYDVVRKMPRKVKTSDRTNSGKTVIAVPPHVFEAYLERMAYNGNSQVNYLSVDPASIDTNITRVTTYPFMGYELAVVPGQEPNTIVMYKSENLHFGTNLFTDMAKVLFLDLENSTGDELFRLRMNFSLNTAVTYANEAVVMAAYFA